MKIRIFNLANNSPLWEVISKFKYAEIHNHGDNTATVYFNTAVEQAILVINDDYSITIIKGNKGATVNRNDFDYIKII